MSCVLSPCFFCICLQHRRQLVDDYVYNGAMIVGDIHTHTRASDFSPKDIEIYDKIIIDSPDRAFYLAGVNGNVYRYNQYTSKADCIGSFRKEPLRILIGSGGSTTIIKQYSVLR